MKQKRTHFLLTDMYRLFTKKGTYLSIIGVALTLFLSVGNRSDITDSAIYTLLLSTYKAGFILTFVFCALPYGSVYSDELETYYMRYAVSRGGLKKYVASKTGIIFLSSVLTMGAGSILFSVICTGKLPWIDSQTYLILEKSGGYAALLKSENYIGWAGLYGIQWGVCGGCLALISSYLSLYISNKLFILAMPALLYQIIIEAGTNTFRKNSMFDPCIIFDARYNIFSSDVKMIAWALAIGICCCIIFGTATYKKLQKRM